MQRYYRELLLTHLIWNGPWSSCGGVWHSGRRAARAGTRKVEGPFEFQRLLLRFTEISNGPTTRTNKRLTRERRGMFDLSGLLGLNRFSERRANDVACNRGLRQIQNTRMGAFRSVGCFHLWERTTAVGAVRFAPGERQ